MSASGGATVDSAVPRPSEPVTALRRSNNSADAKLTRARSSVHTRLISASEDKTIKVWDIAERRVLLTAIGFGDEGYVSYTPEGCYAGSSGVESRLSIFNGSRYEPMTLEARKAMQEPAGFTALLAR